MAEKSLWRTSAFAQDPPHQPSRETIREISRAWKTISNTKTALRHTGNKLDVAPTSSAVFDSIMDAKRAGSSATRKISRKDGRYHEDTNAHNSKRAHPTKSSRERSSRSPLRVTTLDSNVKSSCRVGFREPLASYREVLSSEEKGPGSGLKNYCQDEKDFDSTRSSAVDETTVRYLNDRLAIDNLHWQLRRSQSDLGNDYRDVTPTEPSPHHSAVSPLSNRLETLKRRQPDAKLEKLKERIRRQWELSEERDNRERLPEPVNLTENATSAKTRKVTSAPPAPSYRGFNPPETKIRTPDGKVWQEAEFQNLSAQLHGTLPTTFQEGTTSNEKSQSKRTSRPVRKVQRLAGTDGGASPDGKMVTGHIISTSSWRDGQKLIKQIIGPAPKGERESKPQSNDRQANKEASSTDGQAAKRAVSKDRNSEKRAVPSERQKERRSKSSDRLVHKKVPSKDTLREDGDRPIKAGSSSSRSDSRHPQKSSRSQMDTASKNRNPHNAEEHQDVSTDVKKDFLPLEIRGILDDLQLDSGLDGAKQAQKRSHSPTKRKSEKGQVPEEVHVSSKRRHYDSEQVRLYIMRQQEERKKKQNEQKTAHRQAEEQKNKRLQELYQKQREAFSKAKNVPIVQREKETQESLSNKSLDLNLPRPQDTYSKLLLGETWPPQTEQQKQPKPLYQPSGESDKENKGQERPPSASSSSDLSLSEPLQPLLRSDLMEAYSPQPDKLTSKGALPQSQFLALPKDLESLLNPRKNTVNLFPVNVQFKTSTDFKSNLDRIESLKATAMSLSSRIENEAKKLAGGSVTLPIAWSSEPDPKLTVKMAWRKPDSPPEKESRVDAFSDRIQKMLSTCSSHFSQDDLPGANHLYRKHPEDLTAHTSALLERYDDKEDKKQLSPKLEQSVMASGSQKKASPAHNSSTSSISEGPILSDDSISEGEGQPRHASHLLKDDTLKNKEFCIKDYRSFAPLAEFQREAAKYPPLTSSMRPDFPGPWEELTKGSPHSVINIFTRTFQQHGRALNGYEELEPDLQPMLSAGSPQNSLSYADDFVSSHASESASDSRKEAQQSEDTSASSVREELPLVKSRNDASPRSSHSSSAASSPVSASSQRGSTKRKVWQNNSSPLSVKVEQNSSGSENKSHGSKQTSPVLSASKERSAGSDSDSTMGDVSSRSITSLMSDAGKDIRSQQSGFKDVGGQVPPPPPGHQVGPQAAVPMTEIGQGAVRFSPAGLHQRLSVELNYLGAMEESVRQLCDVERVRGISLAQQETVSLAQILKAQQQRHEQNMAALRQQAEQEAQASMRQLEEARQIAAKTQAEMLQRFQKTIESCAPQSVNRLHEEPDRGYLSPASSDHVVTSSSEQQKRPRSHGTRKKGSRSASPSSLPPSSVSSFKERSHSSSSEQDSQPASSIKEETASHRTLEESISEELPTPERSAAKKDTSLSIDEKGVSSAEPRNEEGIEELSFRSLLPSESHRRGSLERQRRHESDEESTPEKEISGPFSSGQDSFWKFTMEMVRQYMQEGEMRSAHQAALLRLRQKALKDKTKAELAWLEHQKRRLRDKGEDDKMPPLRKRQRGLLLRLQQEQAEIRRLQEANKAARRERQLILKQQEEIQRIQNSTLRIQEKLKSAESGQLEQPSEGNIQPSVLSSHDPSDAETRSPSPVSVSGSETSSIMQKLRKMHSHMDAKFLTKREQQLVQRRLHAQELLEWKRRLDAEELEIRQIEKQALAAWDNQRVKTKGQSTEDPQTGAEDKRSREGSSAPPSPTIQTRTSLSPPPEYLSSESIEPSTIAEQIHEQSGEHCTVSEELPISGPSRMSPPRSSKSPAEYESSKESIKTERQKIHITLRPHQLSHTWSEESLSLTHSEAASDQSDIEGRIRALKEELKKRKSVVENLKREQRRRQKERLRAQEAILLQQLQSYDEYIQKTQAELSGEQGAVPSIKGAQKSSREAVPIRSDSFQRTDSTTSSKVESEHVTEISSKSNAESPSLEKSLASGKETASESIHDISAHTLVPFSTKEDSPSAGPPSPTLREPLLSAHDSPVSSIQSEILEDTLDAQSNRSVSPLPALDLKLGSEAPEENVSLHRDNSYSEDFETSTAFKNSISETPREELDTSYATTPGRDIAGEGSYEQDEFKSASSNFQVVAELKPSSPELSSEIGDPLAEFKLGDRVLVSGVQPGTLRFKGETLFADGVWAGVELDKAEGNNDGSLGGNRYFVCSPLHGIFAPPQKIALLSLEEHMPPLEERSHVETSLEPKEQFDDRTPLIDDLESKSPAKTAMKSTESSVSESQKTLIEKELQAALPTDTPIHDEETQKPRTPLLELTEEYGDATLHERAPEVSTLSDSLLQVCLKDTVSYLYNMRKQRAQKILQSNQELHSIEVTSDPHKERETVPTLDKYQKLDSLHAAFGDKDATSFEPSRNLLSILVDEPDWFDEDFGLSSRKTQQLDLERVRSSGPVSEPKTLAPRPEPSPKSVQPVFPPEPVFAVPHTVPEVEQLVEVAVDKLWEWKQQSGDLEEIRNSFTCNEEEQSPASSAYKEMLFDLTSYIFEEICSPDPRGSQPLWKKPLRVTSSYSRRVRDHSNVDEVKSFLTSEVLNLLSLRKEHNLKTDWQRMMKFGRKKRDRVDHILVQELHEEEAQWVNYDEDELFVKMQLADGIFEALIRDTIQVLQGIQDKKNQTFHV